MIGREISGGHFSKLETFVVRPLMVIEDRNCAGQWYTKSVPWKRKSWIKRSDQSLQNSLHSGHLTQPLITTDYIFINEKWINIALNCEVFSSFEGFSSNYTIITEKTLLILLRNKMLGWLSFYGISTFVGYLTSKPFLSK